MTENSILGLFTNASRLVKAKTKATLNPACHPCPQSGRRASGGAEPWTYEHSWSFGCNEGWK